MSAWSALVELFGSAKRKAPKKPPSLPDAPPDDPEDDDPDEETQEERDERRKLLVIWFRKHLREPMEHRVDQLTEHLAQGRLDSTSWAKAFVHELTKAHGEAWSIGRRLAGDLGPFDEDGFVVGSAAWERQSAYLDSFVRDLEKGRYSKPAKPGGDEEAELNEKAFGARARQYVASVRGSVHESFRQALGDELTDWKLGDAAHCGPSEKYPYNCPDLAAESPKPADQWQTAPARGECPCGGNCGCWISTHDEKYSTEGI